jgi:hypothetical protein
MIQIDRRTLLQSSASALAVLPIAGVSLWESLLPAQEKSHTPQQPGGQPLSQPLMDYVFEKNSRCGAKIASQSIRPADLRTHANELHMLARHFEASNIDARARTLAAAPDGKAALIGFMKNISKGNSPHADAALERLRRHNPSLTRDQVFPSQELPDEHWERAINAVAANGISKHFHDIADFLKTSVPDHTGLITSAYGEGRGASAHLLNVDCKREQKKKAALCGLIVTGAALVVVGTIALLCEGVTAGACTVFISMFAYFAYATIAAFALFLCSLIAVSDPMGLPSGVTMVSI